MIIFDSRLLCLIVRQHSNVGTATVPQLTTIHQKIFKTYCTSHQLQYSLRLAAPINWFPIPGAGNDGIDRINKHFPIYFQMFRLIDMCIYVSIYD